MRVETSTNAIKPKYRFGGLRVSEVAGFGSRFPDWWVPFNDLGSGVADHTVFGGGGTGTFARADAAWTRLSNGLWASIAGGSLRSYYDAAGVYHGAIFEGPAGGRTNRCLWSRDLTNVAWTASNVTAAMDAVGIDGVSNACSTLTATSADGTLLQAITHVSAPRSFNCHMKRKTGTGAVSLTLDNGSTWTDISSSLSSTAFNVVQANQSLANPTVGFKISTSGDAVIIDMAQCENSVGGAGTPMPATTVATTCASDVLTYPITSVNQTTGSCYAEVTTLFDPFAFTVLNRNILASSGSSTAGRPLYIIGGQTKIAALDGTNTVQSSSISLSGTIKCASSWGGTTLLVTANGLTPVSGSFDGNLSMVTAVEVGLAGGGNPCYGTIRDLRAYNRTLQAVELQSMTT